MDFHKQERRAAEKMQKVVEKLKREEVAEFERQEQKVLDEFAQRSHKPR